MWNSIKSLFGFSSGNTIDNTNSDAGGLENNNNNTDDENNIGGDYLSTAKEIKLAQQSLDKLRQDLAEVEEAIKNSKRLVAKAETQQDYFKRTLASLEMECHDEFLHPSTGDDDADDDDEEVKKNSNDDDETENKKNKSSKTTNKNQQVKAQLRAAIHALEGTYLPQIEEQRDNLDLTAFRLTLKLSRLKAEEDDARRKLLSLQAEAHERWEQYTVLAGDQQHQQPGGNNNNNEEGMTTMMGVVPPPPPPSALAASERRNELDNNNRNNQNQNDHNRDDSDDDEEGYSKLENQNDDDKEEEFSSIIAAPPPPELVFKK